MANIIMELTERNLTKHDDRLAEIREKRMIDPNSEKFYRIWSWIRDVNEQLANGGHLTTPQHSRPTTARRRGAGASTAMRGRVDDDWDDGGGGGGGVEDLMGDDDDPAAAMMGKQLRQGVIPMALLNVTTQSAVQRADHVDASMAFIDDDIRAVDEDDFEPANAANRQHHYATSYNNNLGNRQNTWANLTGTSTPRHYVYSNGATQRQSKQQQQPVKFVQNQTTMTTTTTTPINHQNVNQASYQNYPYGPTPSGKYVLVKPAANATTATQQSVTIDATSRTAFNKSKTSQVETAFLSISGGNNSQNSANNQNNGAMTPQVFYQAVSKAAQRASQEGHAAQLQNNAQTAPAAIGRHNHQITQATPVTTLPAGQDRLRSAMSRRTAPATVQFPQPNGSQPNLANPNLQANQVILKLQVSGEQLKPRALNHIESRSQASLISSDPSGGTSKLSLPLMDRIKRLTAKMKPSGFKAAFGGSSNAIAPSNQSLMSRSQGHMSIDSLGDYDERNLISTSQNNLAGVARASPAHHVRFAGVPDSDDSEDYVQQQQQQQSSNFNVFVAANGGKAVDSSSNKNNIAKRFFQTTAQRIYKPFVAHSKGQRPQDSPQIQVTLV